MRGCWGAMETLGAVEGAVEAGRIRDSLFEPDAEETHFGGRRIAQSIEKMVRNLNNKAEIVKQVKRVEHMFKKP